MKFYRYFPPPSDRMGALWTLCGIHDSCILEFGPSGNTSFAKSGFNNLNAEVNADIFTTHVTEDDIVFGDINRIRAALIEIDKIQRPKEIFILSSSLAAVSGTDVSGICEEIKDDINAKLILVDNGGFKGDHTTGIRNTLSLLCNEIVTEAESEKGTYNIIGSQPDCYNFSADVEEIKRIMRKIFGMECHAVFSSGSSIEKIRTASSAMINIVIRSEGIDGAGILKQKFNQEYIFARPYGLLKTLDFVELIKEKTGVVPTINNLEEEIFSCKAALSHVKGRIMHDGPKAIISGNYDLVLGIRSLLQEIGIKPVISIVNHELKGNNYAGYDSSVDMVINPDEDVIEQMLTEIKPDLVLGDDTILRISERLGIKNRFQISNPNSGVVKIFDYTPFVGFRGTVYLCEVLCNLIPSHKTL
ncbi:MAG: nitrogenase component 1 [Methanospirillum sp.]|nr:nitrogenase component 1 [Methanospirillum sp.]